MTWGEFKTYVKQKLQPSGDSVISLTTITVGSAFDTRLQFLLSMYDGDTYGLYSGKTAFTVPTTVDYYNAGALAATPFFEIRKVWIDGGLIAKYDSVLAMENDWDAYSTATGKPMAWTMKSDGVIQFNRIPDSAYSNSFVAGFYTHPAFTSDNDVLHVPNRQVDIAAVYCARLFMEPIVFREETQSKLKRYDAEAFAGAMRIKAENLKRHLDLTQRGGPGRRGW